jgi:hypothetical protein
MFAVLLLLFYCLVISVVWCIDWASPVHIVTHTYWLTRHH